MKKQISETIHNSFAKLNPSFDLKDLSKELNKFRTLNFHSYSFKNQELMTKALIHKSFAHEAKADLENNERLEFLGDSVLQMIITEELMKKFETQNEGFLSKKRSTIVNEKTLSELASYMKLDEVLFIGKGELKNKGQQKSSILSNAFEALLGAMFLDSDYENCKKIFLIFLSEYNAKRKNVFEADDLDAKTKLQELANAKYRALPIYRTKEINDSSESLFEITCVLNDKEIMSLKSHSKKKGMVELATEILKQELI